MKKLFMVLCVVIMFLELQAALTRPIIRQPHQALNQQLQNQLPLLMFQNPVLTRYPSLLHLYCLGLVWLVLQDLDAKGLRNNIE